MSSESGRRLRFEAVAEEVYEPLQRYLRRRARPSDAEDALAEALLTIWRRLDDVPQDAPLPWCYGVARRVLSNQRRSQRRHLRLVEKMKAEPAPAVAPDYAEAGTDPELEAALVSLSAEDQEVLRLWAWEQLEPREIAPVLAVSVNAATLRLSRAREETCQRPVRTESRLCRTQARRRHTGTPRMSYELRRRLARLDPMHSGVPTESTTSESSRELLEQVMSTPTKERAEGRQTPRRTWTIAVAAVAALVLAVAGGLALMGGDETPPVAEAPPLELTAGGEDVMASCIMFSPEELERVAEIAFEGTVTSVEGDTITLTVDNWYRGGDGVTDVVLNAPQGLEALIGGFPFEIGSQYLISAQGGNVNYCGFSGESTPDLRAGFEAAFPQG